MATFFGIEETNTQELLEKNMVCIPRTPDGKLDLHNIVSPLKREDVVFIKHCVTQNILQIKAIGVMKSDYPAQEKFGMCMPVEWVWQGEKVLKNFDEFLSARNDLFYEEHDIIVQRELNNLLPDKYHLQQEW